MVYNLVGSLPSIGNEHWVCLAVWLIMTGVLFNIFLLGSIIYWISLILSTTFFITLIYGAILIVTLVLIMYGVGWRLEIQKQSIEVRFISETQEMLHKELKAVAENVDEYGQQSLARIVRLLKITQELINDVDDPDLKDRHNALLVQVRRINQTLEIPLTLRNGEA